MGRRNEKNSSTYCQRCISFFLEFIERIEQLYPEIYSGGTGESEATGYFETWGWYATINELAKGKPWKFDYIGNMKVHELHLFISHRFSLRKLKEKLRKGNNVTQL